MIKAKVTLTNGKSFYTVWGDDQSFSTSDFGDKTIHALPVFVNLFSITTGKNPIKLLGYKGKIFVRGDKIQFIHIFP